MTYLIAYTIASTVAGVVVFLRWRDAEAKLRMPILPLPLPKMRRKKTRAGR